jgi:hypothetical protein
LYVWKVIERELDITEPPKPMRLSQALDQICDNVILCGCIQFTTATHKIQHSDYSCKICLLDLLHTALHPYKTTYFWNPPS